MNCQAVLIVNCSEHNGVRLCKSFLNAIFILGTLHYKYIHSIASIFGSIKTKLRKLCELVKTCLFRLVEASLYFRNRFYFNKKARLCTFMSFCQLAFSLLLLFVQFYFFLTGVELSQPKKWHC